MHMLGSKLRILFLRGSYLPVAVVKNADRRSEILPKEKTMGTSAPNPLLAVHPQPKAGLFWLFPVIVLIINISVLTGMLRFG